MTAKKDPYAARLGQRIRVLRDQADLTIKELAAKANVNATYITGVENGKHNPTVGIVARLAKALELDPSSVFEALDGSDPQKLRARLDQALTHLGPDELRLMTQLAEALGGKSRERRR
jgi:transcriptional regulator with XRE-family HTH domain